MTYREAMELHCAASARDAVVMCGQCCCSPCCCRGPRGPRGPQGPTGPTGPTGAQGPIGPTGAQGATGSRGPQGLPGARGPAGAPGATGAAGPIGPAGPAGADGATGVAGPIGPAGATGADGVAGPIGPTGPAGAAGPAGPTGEAGPMGPVGPQGVAGADGATGPQGVAGPAGVAGDTGPTGPTGVAALEAYGTYVSTEVRTIPTGTSVPLDATLTTAGGLGFTAGDTVVTALIPGVYQIVYSVRSTVGIGATVQLLVNGTAVANSALSVVVDAGQRTGFATITLAANDTVAIGTSGASIALSSGTNAFLSLLRIA